MPLRSPWPNTNRCSPSPSPVIGPTARAMRRPSSRPPAVAPPVPSIVSTCAVTVPSGPSSTKVKVVGPAPGAGTPVLRPVIRISKGAASGDRPMPDTERKPSRASWMR